MDRIKEQFLARVWEAAEDVYRRQTALLKQQEEALEDDTAGRMSARMGDLAALYGTSQEKQPRYMVISYMRGTGLICTMRIILTRMGSAASGLRFRRLRGALGVLWIWWGRNSGSRRGLRNITWIRF